LMLQPDWGMARLES